ncbi:hypothetical protein [Streptomyces sp. BBFR109]|uniref:hypothetical protein n=1 Tax=Streptomyces sp. BBFR109 TaxID=3448172 RepID=UPI003F75D1B2
MSTLNLQVSASTDDARNVNGNGAFNSNAVSYRIGNDAGTDVWDGFRWLNVTIPQGATITSALLNLYSAETAVGTTAAIIFYGEKSANAATFSSTTAGKPEGRTRTTATAPFSVDTTPWKTTGAGFSTPTFELKDLVQEIVNQATWVSGNALAIVGHDNGSAASNNIGFSTYDRDVTRGAKLSITYTTSGGVVNSNFFAFM